MPRYIDADALWTRLPNDLPFKASVIRVLIQAPEADVVEVEELETAKQDVAREIFEEIEKYYCINKYGEVVVYRDAIAELKKKYTEDKQ